MKKHRTRGSLGSLGKNVDGLNGGKLLGHRKADKMIDGNAVRIGGLLELAVQRIRKSKALVGDLGNPPDDRIHRLPRDENSRIGADKNVVVFGRRALPPARRMVVDLRLWS